MYKIKKKKRIQPEKIPCDRCGLMVSPYTKKRHLKTCIKIPLPHKLVKEMKKKPLRVLSAEYKVSSKKLKEHARLAIGAEEQIAISKKFLGSKTKEFLEKKRLHWEAKMKDTRERCQSCGILLEKTEDDFCFDCIERNRTDIYFEKGSS